MNILARPFVFLLVAGSVSAQNNLFGSIKPPIENLKGDPTEVVTGVYNGAIMIFLFVAFLAALVYGLWGAFEWITSEGLPDKLDKARSKITQAVIGVVLCIVVFVFYSLLVVDILSIFKKDENGNIKYEIPKVTPSK